MVSGALTEEKKPPLLLEFNLALWFFFSPLKEQRQISGIYLEQLWVRCFYCVYIFVTESACLHCSLGIRDSAVSKLNSASQSAFLGGYFLLFVVSSCQM